jgi:hypothetical protein
MIRIFTFVTLILFMSFVKSFAGTYSGGAGTVGNPYQIATTADLIELSKTSADWASHFILTQDIAFNANEQLVDWDGDGTADWDAQDQLGFSPIGNITTHFSGTFDGQGFAIDNLFINRTTQDQVGLFGRMLEASSQIINLGVINAVISGKWYVGGLVGQNSGSSVSNCYSTGSVTGSTFVGGLVALNSGTVSNSYSTVSVTGTNDVGGLVGQNFGTVSNCYSTGNVSGDYYAGGLVAYNSATVSNCYSTGSVTGSTFVGGLVAYNSATVSNCYSTGSVTGSTFVGGLVGYNTSSGTVINSFWDTQTSGRATSAGGTGKTTAQMKTQSTFTDAGWDFSYIWGMCSTMISGYPYLRWQNGEIAVEPPQDGGVYQISTVEHLFWLSKTSSAWASDFILLNDIDMSESQNWECGAGFSPIGNDITNFTGTFDGQGFEIDNLFINRPSQNDVGLFGKTNSDFEVSNLGVTNVDVTGDEFVAGIVGSNDGIVNSCFSSGIVYGNENAGLIVGFNNTGTISFCNSTGDVSGGLSIGGLLGGNFSGIVSNCNSSGTVSGDNNVGGLVGFNYYTSVTQSYSSCDVTTSYYTAGGLVGINYSLVSNCYATGDVDGIENIGGLIGSNSGDVNNCYSSGLVSGTTDVGGLIGENYETVTNSFWDTETSLLATSAGGTGKITADMKTQSTFTSAGWDFLHIWRINSPTNDGYPYFAWQDPCQSQTYINASFNNSSPGWQITQFNNLNDALAISCSEATVNISNYTHTGDVDMTGYTFIIGDGDFDLDGVLSGGLIQTPSTGRLILPAVQNVQRNYPIGDGTNNYTLKINPLNAPTNPIIVRLYEQSVPGAIQDPMQFWEIEGDDNLNATIVFRIDKSAIAPKTLNTNSLLRFNDGTGYIPMTENQVTINDKCLYYEIIIINVNKF